MTMNKFTAGEKYEIELTQEMADQLNAIVALGLTHTNCKIISYTFETKEYNKINKLIGNRTINLKNVKNKKELLKKNGFKSTNPVIINTDGEIIDGQHRAIAAEELDIPIKLMVAVDVQPEDSLKSTIELNNSGKPWGMIDYVNAYAECGNQNYIDLLELQQEMNLNLSKTMLLYYGSKTSSSYTQQVNKGEFVYNIGRANIARQRKVELDSLLDSTDNPKYKAIIRSQNFYSSYLELTRAEGFKFNNIKSQFDKMRYTLLDPRDMTKTLFETYNYRKGANKVAYDNLKTSGLK